MDHSRSILRFLTYVLCVFAGLSAHLVDAQTEPASIRGTVTGAGTGAPIDGASVQVAGTAYRTTTDRFGRYSIEQLPTGSFEILVRAVGYAQVTRQVSTAEGAATENFALQTSEEVFEMEEYVIDSEVSASARALSRQNAADNRVDIVASDKFGLLPDPTVADALRRLPGISVEKDSQGRAERYVTIRGMNSDFNTVAVNGQKVMVSNFGGASRSVPLDVVPSKNAESIEVTKSVLPSDDADAIGGRINIRSASAFDNSGQTASLEASVGMLSLVDKYTGSYPHDETPYEFSAAWSNTLDAEGTMGLALALNHSLRPYLFSSVENGSYSEDAGDYFPSYGRLEEAFDNVEMTGATGRFDFRPSDTFEMSVDFNYSKRDTNQGSQRATAYYDTRYLVGDVETIGNTASSFASEDRSEYEVRDYYEEQENLTVSVDVLQQFGDFELTYGGGVNMGDFAGDPNRDLRAFFRTDFEDAQGNYYFNTYDFQAGDAYSPQLGGDFATNDASEYAVFEIRRGTRIIEDRTYSGYIDLKRDMLWGNLPGYLKGGIKMVQSDRDFDDLRNRYRTADVDWTLDSVVINGTEQVYGSVLADYGVDKALNGQEFRFMIDPDKVRAAEQALRAAGLRDEGDEDWYLNRNEARDARADLVNSYDLEEQVAAGYLEAEMKWENLTLIAGFRAESTDVEVDTYAGDFFESDPDEPLFIQPIKGENDYVNVLPHLHVRYNFGPDTTLRASVNQTLARPSYRQLNPSTDIDPVDEIVVKGNTGIDPVVSTNLDVSVDHYFGNSGSVSAALFYKSMENNIYRFTRGVLPTDPSNYPAGAEVREFLNADSAEVFGVELAVNYRLDALHESLYGFEVSANYTYTDSSVDGLGRNVETPLFGQVPHTVNLALNFARWGFESRIAWNWTDAYLDFEGINADPNLDTYLDARSRVDFSLRYSFKSNWMIFVEIQNLLDDDSRAYRGDSDTRMFYREESGRLSVIGLRWNM